MATVVTRYVNPDSSGGDGTTNATSGAQAAYASLSAWNTARARNLVTADEIEEVICESNGTADTTAALLENASWVTDPTRYISIKAGPNDRAGTKWDTTKYRLLRNTNGSSGSTILALSNFSSTTVRHVRVDGLQLGWDVSIWGAPGWSIYLLSHSAFSGTSASEVHISNCHFRAYGVSPWADWTGGFHAFILINPSDTTANPYPIIKIYNNIFHWAITGVTSYASRPQLVRVEHRLHNAYIYNNTIIDDSGLCIGISGDNDSTRFHYLRNNLIKGTFTATVENANRCDYNATDLASLGYTANTHDRVSQTFTFAAADDFRLTAADTGAKDYGVSDPGSGLFSTDIAGTTRSGSWDIGAYEYVDAGGLFGVRQCANGQLQASGFYEVADLYPAMRIGSNVTVQMHEMIEESGRTTHQINSSGVYRCGEFKEI